MIDEGTGTAKPWQQIWMENPELNPAGLWTVRPAQRVRVALAYGGTWRPNGHGSEGAWPPHSYVYVAVPAQPTA
jgi:hypothetical protein